MTNKNYERKEKTTSLFGDKVYQKLSMPEVYTKLSTKPAELERTVLSIFEDNKLREAVRRSDKTIGFAIAHDPRRLFRYVNLTLHPEEWMRVEVRDGPFYHTCKVTKVNDRLCYTARRRGSSDGIYPDTVHTCSLQKIMNDADMTAESVLSSLLTAITSKI